MRFHQKCLKPVVFTEIDFASLDEDSGVVNVTIEGMGSFSLAADDAGNPSDIFAVPFGTTLIPAGADITVSLSSPTVPDATVRIAEITVSTDPIMADCLLGDVDLSGTINFLDIQPFINVLAGL